MADQLSLEAVWAVGRLVRSGMPKQEAELLVRKEMGEQAMCKPKPLPSHEGGYDDYCDFSAWKP